MRRNSKQDQRAYDVKLSNTPTARGGAEIGFRKPPKRTQFQPGQSGNPAGRPKGVRNLETDLQETLRELVEVNKGGVVRRITTQKAMLVTLAQKALAGDVRANDQLLRLILRCQDSKGETDDTAITDPVTVIAEDDSAILDEYYHDRRAREAEDAAFGSSDTSDRQDP